MFSALDPDPEAKKAILIGIVGIIIAQKQVYCAKKAFFFNKPKVMSRKFVSFAPQNYKTISIYKLKNKNYVRSRS